LQELGEEKRPKIKKNRSLSSQSVKQKLNLQVEDQMDHPDCQRLRR
jgi:hypothetical protein